MSEQSKQNRIFVISLIFLFLVLAGYLAIRISTIQKTTMTYADEGTQDSLNCNSYSYNIKNQEYNEEKQEVTFTIKNQYGKNIDKIILEINGEIQEIETPELYAIGEEEIIITNINTKPTQIYVYTENCETIKKEVLFE